MPKAAAAVARRVAEDIAAQLKQAMRSNAFGDLRFSGRDPVEVIDELRAQRGRRRPDPRRRPIARSRRAFEEVCEQVLANARAARRDDSDERGGRAQRPW